MEVANNAGFRIPEKLRQSGIKFIPLRPKSKAPCETGFRGKPKDAENIERHVAAGGNYAVLAGTGGVLVVDCDTPEAKEVSDVKLPETFTVRTGKKGFHHYFRCPEISGIIRLRKDKVQYGEIISTGGLATGPGSIHPDTGRVYEVVRDVEIAEVSGEALRAAFADFITMDSVSGEESDKTSERSDIEILPVVEKSGIQLTPRGDLLEGPHPVHGSSSGNNFLVDPAKNLWHCFR
ncbi:MAG: bifunctional DNA primase/polymerase, partial [Spirochaetia bacterium]|nr:bifunctional DNA primase/polymerase [Spirochaetia bacterium]